MSIVRNQIAQFRNKASCHHTQEKAKSIWNYLVSMLEPSEINRLRIAWNHVRFGEGNEELYAVCNELEAKYAA